ncbi:MAG: ABC transporter ATP-binding protein, partial [Candidatus Bathyarchaeia archaeon]
MSNKEELLKVNNLIKSFSVRRGVFGRDEFKAVDDISFTILKEPPTFFTVIGESGSGKTTLARLILGLIRPTSGKIIYDGKDIWKMREEEWKKYRKEVQAVFQDPFSTYNPFYRVSRVLMMPLLQYKLVNGKKEAYEIISKSLEVAGLRKDEVIDRFPHQLSGGQRQRIMLARALMLKPTLILADEPVSMVDASIRASLLNTMLDMKNKFKISFIYITHDLSTAYYLTDKMAVMYLGNFVEIGPAEKIINEPLHPYTQMLIESVPIADPKHRWKSKVNLPSTEYSI